MSLEEPRFLTHWLHLETLNCFQNQSHLGHLLCVWFCPRFLLVTHWASVAYMSRLMIQLHSAVLCTLYSVLCTLYAVLSTQCPVLCTLYPVPCTLYSLLCTLYFCCTQLEEAKLLHPVEAVFEQGALRCSVPLLTKCLPIREPSVRLFISICLEGDATAQLQ